MGAAGGTHSGAGVGKGDDHTVCTAAHYNRGKGFCQSRCYHGCVDLYDTMRGLPPVGAWGAYLLQFRLEEPLELDAGRLGRVLLPAGWLAYVGSAMGPGGLRRRLERHLRRDKRLHWHIDYLTTVCTPVAWESEVGEERRECAWVRRLLALPGTTVPAPGFGSSDCREGCPAHLVALPRSNVVGLPSRLC